MSVLLRSMLVLSIGILAAGSGMALGATPKAGPGQPSAGAASKAETRAKRLDNLFAALKLTDDESVADRIINRIWMTWHQTDSTKINDLVTLAVIYTDEREYDAALEKLNEVVKLAPEFAEGWNRRATLFYLMGRYDESLVDIKKTLELEPRHFGALAGRGLIHHARGEYRQALQAFEAALRINPFLRERHSLIPALRQKLGEQKI